MRFSLIVFVVFSITSCDPKVLPTDINLDEDRVTVKMSHETTKAELDQLKKDLHDKYQITMSYDGTTFFDNGRVRDMEVKLANDNGPIGNYSCMLAQLQYNYYGFIISINEGHVKVGQM